MPVHQFQDEKDGKITKKRKMDNTIVMFCSRQSMGTNVQEGKKDSISPTRLFFPTFEVDKKMFAGDNAYTLEMFMEYSKNANTSYGGQTMLQEADIVFIPVGNGQHKFLVCVNLKNLGVTLIYSKKEEIKLRARKRKMTILMMRELHQFCDIGKWKCGLNVKGKKHNTQLGRLRNQYTAKLLLSDCNIYKGKIREEMDGK
uniref:Ulp1 protease family, C-terminal catalytic domain-containing protein n=1 Tax=Tanacetum cinerariifolium TaxID=118510 RepID=A0A6L2MWA2_TANCI|nr:ulp1 protease family, C-terminal catalytic domain-containing protein [Tanacetum cinerariifolium]